MIEPEMSGSQKMTPAPITEALDLIYKLAALKAHLSESEQETVHTTFRDKFLMDGKELVTTLETKSAQSAGFPAASTANAVGVPAVAIVRQEDKSEFAAVKAGAVIEFIGDHAGESSISRILAHLNARGLNIERPTLTTMLNRMCKPGKISKFAPLESIADRRGWFALSADGRKAYRTLKGDSEV